MSEAPHPAAPRRTTLRFSDWARKPHYAAETVEERSSACGTLEMSVARLAEAFGDPPTSDLPLCLITRGTAPEVNRLDLGFGRFAFRPRPGILVPFTPEAPTEIVGPGPYELMVLAIPWQTVRPRLEAVLDRPLDHLPPELHQNHADATLETTMHRLWRCLDACGPGDRLAADGLVNVLLGRLLSLGSASVPDPGRRAKLHPRRLAAVIEYVDARIRLADALSLDELADVAGCSRFHFGRLFKASTGQSPIVWVGQRRIERAQSLIRDHPEWTLAAVALASGFSDQSHLTRQFKRIVGVTPGVWRQDAIG